MSIDIENEIRNIAPDFTQKIREAASLSKNEAEFRIKIAPLIEEFSKKLRLTIPIREEYTLIRGRADAVYNRLVIEYECPGKLRHDNRYRSNRDSIKQVEDYIEDLSKKERHRKERLAGVAFDGNYFIFVRFREDTWYIDEPLKVDIYSTERFLKLLASLSTELALIPENLVRDFGENNQISRKVVSTLFNALTTSDNPKVKTLFEQWRLQFSEVCDYERTSKLKIEDFARKFGIPAKNVKLFPFFFSLHTYYAVLIKLLAIQIVHYYIMPKGKTDLKQVATFTNEELKNYLKGMEDGGIFRDIGINNFLEGDFFSWYLDIWNDAIYDAFKRLISTLANYSLLTLDVDPDTTRDLLKKLYQQLMPKELRHNLGEYYTPDWLAERLLNMLEGGKFEGNPNKGLLDPTCGSGTFLVLAIKKIKQYAKEKKIEPRIVLEKILSNIVGFDLNPLAVISARTNYLLALGDLLEHMKEPITIPVYLCDSIITPQEGEDIFGWGKLKVNTAVGPFFIPKNLVKAEYIDELSNFLEEAVKLKYNKNQFIQVLCQRLPLNQDQDENDIKVIYELYEKLLNLEKQGINGIWARVIKNAFAPLFKGKFDYIAGNPPWVNWEHLPEDYRKDTLKVWHYYELVPPKGLGAILGKSKMDISVLMTYVGLDKYLYKGGRLGFLITQSVFKTGASQSFRRFRLKDSIPIRVLHVDDMVKLNPFEGIGNRTSIIILQKGKETKYPVPYNYWVKKIRGKSIKDDLSLNEVIELATYKKFVAEPVNKNDTTSPWITGRPKALKAVRKVLGQSDYTAHAGVYTGGANAVYWVEIVDKKPNGLVIISNITEGAKREVERVQTAIEPDLLYPLLRGRDVKKWKAEPSAHIIMTRSPSQINKKAISENEIKIKYPKTFLYLSRFKEILLSRRDAVLQRSFKSIPFYSLAAVSDYTFAPYKVVWTRIANIEAAVVSTLEGKPIIPQETITLVACSSEEEAHYIAATVNSSPFQFAVISYSQAGGKSMGSMHVLENICIPKFDSRNPLHVELAKLSKKAHLTANVDDKDTLQELEDEIDIVSAQIWGLTEDELKEIKISLEELTG